MQLTTSNINENSMTYGSDAESRLRARVLMVSALFGAPLLFWFGMLEIRLQNPDMVLVNLSGALLCVVNFLVAYYRGFRRTFARPRLRQSAQTE